MATHVGIAGGSNDWSAPSEFLLKMATLLGVSVVLHTMVGWLDRVPDRFRNLANKGSWLTADRRDGLWQR